MQKRKYRAAVQPIFREDFEKIVNEFMETNLCKELNLMMVTVPLIVDVGSGVNDDLGRDGSRTPIQFHITNDYNKHPLDAQVVHAANRWKRLALRQFDMQAGEGICTDMHSVREDNFLDHDHSVYKLKTNTYPDLPHELKFLHAENILDKFPNLPPQRRETAILREYPAIFIYGVGWTLKDGHPHGTRAADYHDWVTETKSADGRPMHGLNGDIVVWNPVTQRRHELMSSGICVNAASLKKQLELTGRLDWLKLPYHQAGMKNEIPASSG